MIRHPTLRRRNRRNGALGGPDEAFSAGLADRNGRWTVGGWRWACDGRAGGRGGGGGRLERKGRGREISGMTVRPIRILLVLLVVVVATSPGEVRARGGGGIPTTGQAADRGTVVLLHGLGRTHRSMTRVEGALVRRGYRVVNLGYPSRDATWGQLVDSVATAVDACCRGGSGPVHFVTHSMGGILVRAYLEEHSLPTLGRVVMLSPPNQGTAVVDRIPEELLTLLLGPASVLLGTDSASVPLQLGPAEFELGVITGDVSMNRLFSLWLPGDDDGTVAVESAWVEGTDAFLVVPYTHTFIMRREEVILQILAFLETGRFVDARSVP